MVKVIDLELDLPPTVEQIVDRLRDGLFHSHEKGLANYRHVFGEARARFLDFTPEEVLHLKQDLSAPEIDHVLTTRAEKAAITLPQFIAQMDEVGIEWGAIDAGSPGQTAEIVAKYPARFVGTAIVNPHQGMKAVRDLEHAVRGLGLKCFYASPFRSGIHANDKKFYPLYAKAVELDIPVYIDTSRTYRTDHAMDIGGPLYVDEIAKDFPDLRIIAGLGGWPWAPEIVGLARRHQNVYISTAGYLPEYLATPGPGGEMLMQFGQTLLQDRIIFASSWFTYSRPLKNIIEETMALPLKSEVKEKWLYQNARRLFRLEK